MPKCPHCGSSGPFEKTSANTYSCVACARESYIKLTPFRGETRRLELVQTSRQNDHRNGTFYYGSALPGERKHYE